MTRYVEYLIISTSAVKTTLISSILGGSYNGKDQSVTIQENNTYTYDDERLASLADFIWANQVWFDTPLLACWVYPLVRLIIKLQF